MTVSVEQAFWSKVKITPRCWEWTGWLSLKGYGMLTRGDASRRAHRVMAEVAGFKIPHGFVSDHLCRNRRCVNPEHIEFVTNRENVLRGFGPTAIHARQTHCFRGHEFNPLNTHYGKSGRICRVCQRKRKNFRNKLIREASRKKPEQGKEKA